MELQKAQAVLCKARGVIRELEERVFQLRGRMPSQCEIWRMELDEAVDGIIRPLHEAERRMWLLHQELQKEIDYAKA